MSLMVSLRDNSRGLEGTKVLEIVDEIEASVSQLAIPFFNLIPIQTASSFESTVKLRNGVHGTSSRASSLRAKSKMESIGFIGILTPR